MSGRPEGYLLVALLTACYIGTAHAERSDRDKPVYIEADSARLDDQQNLAVYEGKVQLSQGTMSLSADRIEVRQDGRGFSNGVAVGKPVRFRQKQDGKDEWIEGWAQRIEYDAHAAILKLVGTAQLKKGQDELRGEIITYDAKSERYQARGAAPGQPSGRVRAVIQPKGGGDGDPATAADRP